MVCPGVLSDTRFSYMGLIGVGVNRRTSGLLPSNKKMVLNYSGLREKWINHDLMLRGKDVV